jgi:hypothetical protein
MAQRKGSITIKNLYGGWATDFSQSNSAAVEGLVGEYTQSSTISLFRQGFEGHIAPGPVFDAITDGSTRVTGKPLNGAMFSNSEVFVLLDNARIVEFGTTDDVIDANHDISAHGGHNTPTTANGDIVAFYQQTGTPPTFTTEEYIFYSWEDNTDGDVGRLTKTGTSYSDSYLSGLGTQNNGTALVKGAPHPLLIGKNDFLYVGNGRYLASHDPTTTTVDYKAFDLKPGWVISALGTYQNYIAILAYRANTAGSNVNRSEAKVYLWNGTDPSWNFEYDLKDYYASALLNDGDDIYVITSGRNATTKLKRFTGSGFETLYESFQIGDAPGIGGMEFFYNHLIWGEQNGRLLAYGSPDPKKYSSGFHYFAGATNVGMVKNFKSNSLYIGDKNGSTYTIRKINYAKYATSSSLRTCLLDFPANSTITSVQKWFSQFGSGASLTTSFFKDYTTVSIGGVTDEINEQITNSTLGAITYHPTLKNIDTVQSGYLVFTHDHASASNTAAIIRKVKINYVYDDETI